MKELEILDCQPANYTRFGLGERHGSYEVTCGKKEDNGLTRFVTVSVSPPPDSETRLHRVEVWAGASSQDRFARYLVAYWDSLRTQDLNEGSIKTAVMGAVDEAADRANDLQPSDLTQGIERRLLPEETELRELNNILGTAPKGNCAESDQSESGGSR